MLACRAHPCSNLKPLVSPIILMRLGLVVIFGHGCARDVPDQVVHRSCLLLGGGRACIGRRVRERVVLVLG